MKNGYLTPAIAAGMTTNLTTLQDTVSNLERICNTPLPFAYQVHLRMSLWLYLLFLPVGFHTWILRFAKLIILTPSVPNLWPIWLGYHSRNSLRIFLAP